MKRRTRKKAKKSLRLIALLALLGVGVRGMFWVFPALNTFFYNLTVFSAATLMPQGGAQLVKDALAPAEPEVSQPNPPVVSSSPESSQTQTPPEQNQTSSASSQPDTSSQTEAMRPYDPPIADPENDGTVVEETFATTGNPPEYIQYGNGYIKNITEETAETLQEILQTPWESGLGDNQSPQVLIVHTHATESYEPNDDLYFNRNETWRTNDTLYNVCAVGDVIEQRLTQAGFNVIHDETLHDYPSYNGSYDRSAQTIKSYLAKYPSIKVVLDVHRDAVVRSQDVIVRPVTEINGKRAAQVMILAGCETDTMSIPTWKDNLRFAAALQDNMNTLYPTLARPVYLNYSRYNQHLSSGSLLLEMGGHANTLEEALYSAELVSDALIKTLNEHP